jgi:hypothetical protein
MFIFEVSKGMRSYAIGRVYKIVNTMDELIYIGATGATLSHRMVQHRANAKTGKTSTIYTHMRDIGIEKFSIILIEQLENVTKEQLRAKEDKWIKELDTVNNGLNGRYEMGQTCIHNKRRSNCKECGGSAICIHNKYRSSCKECNGSAICIHNKQRLQCKECEGSSICIHNKYRSSCKECKGSAICIHNKQRLQCKECEGSAICIHNKYRSSCKECNGSAICIHNKQRHQCKECNGDKFKCEPCHKLYGSKQGLSRHNLKCHPIIIVAEPNPEPN